MKKTIALMIIAAMALMILTACGKQTEQAEADGTEASTIQDISDEENVTTDIEADTVNEKTGQPAASVGVYPGAEGLIEVALNTSSLNEAKEHDAACKVKIPLNYRVTFTVIDEDGAADYIDGGSFGKDLVSDAIENGILSEDGILLATEVLPGAVIISPEGGVDVGGKDAWGSYNIGVWDTEYGTFDDYKEMNPGGIELRGINGNLAYIFKRESSPDYWDYTCDLDGKFIFYVSYSGGLQDIMTMEEFGNLMKEMIVME